MKSLNKYKYSLTSISLHVLEHLDEKTLTNLPEIFFDMLCEYGKVFIAVPNALSSTGLYWRYEDFTHNRIFTVGSLQFVLSNVKLEKCSTSR